MLTLENTEAAPVVELENAGAGLPIVKLTSPEPGRQASKASSSRGKLFSRSKSKSKSTELLVTTDGWVNKVKGFFSKSSENLTQKERASSANTSASSSVNSSPVIRRRVVGAQSLLTPLKTFGVVIQELQAAQVQRGDSASADSTTPNIEAEQDKNEAEAEQDDRRRVVGAQSLLTPLKTFGVVIQELQAAQVQRGDSASADSSTPNIEAEQDENEAEAEQDEDEEDEEVAIIVVSYSYDVDKQELVGIGTTEAKQELVGIGTTEAKQELVGIGTTGAKRELVGRGTTGASVGTVRLQRLELLEVIQKLEIKNAKVRYWLDSLIGAEISHIKGEVKLIIVKLQKLQVKIVKEQNEVKTAGPATMELTEAKVRLEKIKKRNKIKIRKIS